MPLSPDDKICLTLASGGLGSTTLHHLLHTLQIPPRQLIVALRNPSKLPADLPSDVGVRRADYDELESLEAAFAGATKVILISYPSIAHEVRVRAHKAGIDAAKKVGCCC